MIFFLRIFSIFIRFIFSNSKTVLRIKRLITHNVLRSSFEGFKENSFLNSEFGDTDITHLQYHSNIIIRLFHFLLENQPLQLLFFALVDIVIARCLNNLLKVNRNDEDIIKEKSIIKIHNGFDLNSHWIEILYLFNPLSIINCISLNFDQVYTLFLFLCITHFDNLMLGPFLFAFSLVVNSSGFFTCLSTFIYLIFYTNLLKNRFKFLQNFIISLIFLVVLSIYLTGFQSVTYALSSKNSFNHHLNYYYHIKDTLPNLMMIWYLVSETFLKYNLFVKQMIILYQVLANISIITLIKRSSYKNHLSLLFSLLFMVNNILERYGSYNDLVILVLMVCLHYDITKYSKNFEISMMALIEVFLLVIGRGYIFYHKNIGGSNHLYFQNFALAIGLVINILLNIYAVKKYRHENISREIVNDIINSAIIK